MYYTNQIQKIRDEIQKEIVSAAVSTPSVFDGIIEFHNSVDVTHVDDTRYTTVKINGVDISTGELIDIHDMVIPFKNLTVESLNLIHEVVVIKKAFTFKPDLFV